jgi:hypothetical protein
MTIQIQHPDGRQIEIEGDVMPSEAEIEGIFSSLSSSEPSRAPLDVEANREAALRKQAEDRGFLGNLGTGIDSGARRVQRGVSSLLPDAASEFLGLESEIDPIGQKAQEISSEVSPVANIVGTVIGESLPFAGLALTAAPASIAGRVALSAGLGGLEAGVVARGDEKDAQESLKRAAIGAGAAGTASAVLEKFLPSSLAAISRVGKSILKKAGRGSDEVLTATGELSPDMLQAMQKFDISEDDVVNLSSKALRTQDSRNVTERARKELIESQGVSPTQAQVTGDASDLAAQSNLADSPGILADQVRQQKQALNTRASQLAGETGEFVSPIVVAKQKIDESLKTADDLYKAARETDTGNVIRVTELAKTLRELAPEDELLGGVVGQFRRILSDSDASVLSPDTFAPLGRVNAQQAENIRKTLNRATGNDPSRNRAISQIKEALDKDVIRTVSSDVFSSARKEFAGLRNALKSVKTNKLGKQRASIVQKISNGTVDEENIVDLAVLGKGSRPADLEEFVKFIGSDGKKALKTDTLTTVFSKARSPDGDISANDVRKLLGRIGKGKIDALFSVSEQKQLQRFLKVVDITKKGKPVSKVSLAEIAGQIKGLPLIKPVLDALKSGDLGSVGIVKPTGKIERRTNILGSSSLGGSIGSDE